MNRAWILALAATLILAASATLGDEFDQLEGRPLADLPGSDSAEAHEALSVAELVALPRVLQGVRSTALIVKTDQGNPARLLLAPGFLQAEGGDEPTPILVVERFETFEAGPATSRLARGREVVLFDGYRLDLDAGRIVPDGHGGDLRFDAGARPGDGRLSTLGGAKLYTLRRSPLAAAPEAGRPSPGRSVLPGDFAGRYRLAANGQWTGLLELESAADGSLSGRFRSDQTGSSYRITGGVDGNEPNLARFDAQLPRTRLEFEGRLFTEGKGAISGSVRLLDRPYAFFAVREGGKLAPDPIDEGPAAGPMPLLVELGADGSFRLGRESVPGDEAGVEAVLGAIGEDRGRAVLVRVEPSVAYVRVATLLEHLRAAGVEDLRLEVASPRP